MQRLIIKPFIILGTIFSIISCGFHLNKTVLIPNNQIKNLILQSDDPYSPLVYELRQQLILNHINIIENNNKLILQYPILYINSENLKINLSPLFIDNNIVEYSLVMTVNVSLLLPNKPIYSINTEVSHLILENFCTILMRDIKKDIAIQQMRKSIAEQLINKILTLNIIH